MTIADVLERKGNTVATITTTAPVAEAVALLAQHNFGAVAVLDTTGAVAGILSERDIVQRLNEAGYALLERPASEVMTPDPLTCTRYGTITDVLQMMVGWHVRHLPVVEDDKLIGLISMGDLLKCYIDRGGFDDPHTPPQPC